MKVVFIILVIAFFLLVLFLSSTSVVFNKEEVKLGNLRKFLVSVLFLSIVIAGLIYYDQASALTEITTTNFQLSLYLEDGKSDPLGFYVKQVPSDESISFYFRDSEAQKVLEGKVPIKSVEYIINSNVEPSIRIVEARVRHRITGREYVVPYYIFTIPSVDSINTAGVNDTNI